MKQQQQLCSELTNCTPCLLSASPHCAYGLYGKLLAETPELRTDGRCVRFANNKFEIDAMDDPARSGGARVQELKAEVLTQLGLQQDVSKLNKGGLLVPVRVHIDREDGEDVREVTLRLAVTRWWT